jgi:hypothetical protein
MVGPVGNWGLQSKGVRWGTSGNMAHSLAMHQSYTAQENYRTERLYTYTCGTERPAFHLRPPVSHLSNLQSSDVQARPGRRKTDQV